MIVIKDNLTAPFHINIDEMGNHALIRTIKGKNKAGEDINTESTIGHFNSLFNCLRRMVQQKLVRRNQTMTLKEYIDNFSAELDKISELIKI